MFLWMISLAQVSRTGLRCPGVQDDDEEELTGRVFAFQVAVVIFFLYFICV